MTIQISIQKRGCGFPKSGKIYLTVPTDSEKGGFYGNPIWNYVLCVSGVLNPDFKLNFLGMQCISRGVFNSNGQEIFDIWDWVGHGNYPNVTDWILETDKLGFHQLIEKTFPFNKLMIESYYYAVHSAAGIQHPLVYFEQRIPLDEYPLCPQRHKEHIELENKDWLNVYGNGDTCSGLYFNDIKDGKNINGREVIREMPSFQYHGYSAPIVRNDLKYDEAYYPAVFFRIPLGRIGSFTIYEDKISNEHELTLKKLEQLDEKLKKINIVSL